MFDIIKVYMHKLLKYYSNKRVIKKGEPLVEMRISAKREVGLGFTDITATILRLYVLTTKECSLWK